MQTVESLVEDVPSGPEVTVATDVQVENPPIPSVDNESEIYCVTVLPSPPG